MESRQELLKTKREKATASNTGESGPSLIDEAEASLITGGNDVVAQCACVICQNPPSACSCWDPPSE